MPGIGRRSLLQTASVAAGGLALGAHLATTASAAPARSARAAAGSVMVRWIGGGLVEVATQDNKQRAYVDAWVWNNAAYKVPKGQRPAEVATPHRIYDYVAAKTPHSPLVL